MKLLLALVAAICIAGVCAVSPINLASVYEQECGKLHNVDPEEMAHMKRDARFIPTRVMTCFAACVMQKEGVLGADGKFTEKFDKEKGRMGSCQPEYETDVCETVGNLIKCLKKQEIAQRSQDKLAEEGH